MREDFLRCLVILPEILAGYLFFDFRKIAALGGSVKENSEALGRGPSIRGIPFPIHHCLESRSLLFSQRENTRQNNCGRNRHAQPSENVTVLGVKRVAPYEIERTGEHAQFVSRQPGHDLPARINNRRHAVVGGPQQVAAVFDGPQPRHLQVLQASGGIAKPAVIGNVDQNSGAVGFRTSCGKMDS